MWLSCNQKRLSLGFSLCTSFLRCILQWNNLVDVLFLVSIIICWCFELVVIVFVRSKCHCITKISASNMRHSILFVSSRVIANQMAKGWSQLFRSWVSSKSISIVTVIWKLSQWYMYIANPLPVVFSYTYLSYWSWVVSWKYMCVLLLIIMIIVSLIVIYWESTSRTV